MLPDNMNKVDRKKVEEYQSRMRADGRCTQCINPWYDGLCECNKWNDNKLECDEIERIVIHALYPPKAV